MLYPGQDGYWVDIKKDAATLSKVHYLPSTGHIPGSDHQSTEILQYTSHRHSQTIIGKVHTHHVFEIIRKQPLMEITSLFDTMMCLYHTLLGK